LSHPEAHERNQQRKSREQKIRKWPELKKCPQTGVTEMRHEFSETQASSPKEEETREDKPESDADHPQYL